MKSLLGIGECMIELSSAGKNLWKQGFAGDVFNTLWYARAMLPDDWAVSFHTAVGTDPASCEMIDFIEAASISCADIPKIPDRLPGLYTIHLDGAERSFSYWRSSSAARKLMSDPDRLWRKVAAADLVYLSGITLAILPPGESEVLIHQLRSHLKEGARIAFDPNIRPRLWDSEARMQKTLTDAASISDIVLPSYDDEASAFGDTSPEQTARRFQAAGASLVVVKNGDAPTVMLEAGAIRTFPVKKISGVVDTTAAGDSFNGAFFAELLVSGDSEKAISAGQTCAGKVVCSKGALVAINELSVQ